MRSRNPEKSYGASVKHAKRDSCESEQSDRRDRSVNTGKTNNTIAISQKHCRHFGYLTSSNWWRKPIPVYRSVFLITVFFLFMIASYFIFAQSSDIRQLRRPAGGQGPRQLVPPNPVEPLPPSASKLHIFKRAAVSSDSEVCSDIGKKILQENGNIADATLATMFCNGLITMQSMGIGGGFVMNLYLHKNRTAYTLNARERAPIRINDPNLFPNGFQAEGSLSIAVPGELCGYWELHKRFGTMTWADILRPTIDICDGGFAMTKHMADFLLPQFKNDTNLRLMFVDNVGNDFRIAGTTIRPAPSLCQTYRLIAQHGGDDFYNGTLAKLVLADLQQIGSIISVDDLRAYRAVWSESMAVPLGKDTMYVTPAPSSGPIVAFVMNALKGYDSDRSPRVALTRHRIVETFKFAFAHRWRLCDPDFCDINDLIRNLTSASYADEIRRRIEDVTFSSYRHYGAEEQPVETMRHGTSHVSIIAPNGDAVSVTSSINYYFGCGISGNRTGIVFNSGMDDFSQSQRPNYFGLPPATVNEAQPLKQAVSSMSPVILTDRRGHVKIVIGATGGPKIVTATSMALVRMLWFHEDVKQAVDSPRFHHQLHPMLLEYEYGNLLSHVAELERLGHRTHRYAERGSIVTALTRNLTGVFGNADYRKRGQVVGF